MISCNACGTNFACQPGGGCWCNDLPPVLAAVPGGSCLCPTCLTEAIQAYFEANPEAAKAYRVRTPIEKRPAKDFVEGRDYYLNEAGNWVFTGYYHLKKGYCCQNACRHCPYGYAKTTNL